MDRIGIGLYANSTPTYSAEYQVNTGRRSWCHFDLRNLKISFLEFWKIITGYGQI